MPANSYALGYLDYNKLPEYMRYQGANPDEIPEGFDRNSPLPYAKIWGQQLGLDNNYNYAVTPDGSVQQLFVGNKNTGWNADEGMPFTDQQTMTAQQLGERYGWDYANAPRDAHGYALPGNVGGYDWQPYTNPGQHSGGGIWDFLPSVAFGLMTAGVGGLAAAGAGLSGGAATATSGAVSGAASSGAAGGNPLIGAATGAIGGAVGAPVSEAAGGGALGSAAGGAAAGATKALISGGDPVRGSLGGATGSLVGNIGSDGTAGSADGYGDAFGTADDWEAGTGALGTGNAATGGTAALGNANSAANGGGMDDWEQEFNNAYGPDDLTSEEWQNAIDAGGGSSDMSDFAKWAWKNRGILGAGGGALLGGLGGGSRPAGTTTTVQDIPDWLKPYVVGNLNQAGNARDALLAGPNVTGAATPQYMKTVNGDYLMPGSNPFLDATYNHAAGLVGAGVDSRFESAGRYGSGAHQGVLQEGLNNLATSIYGGNYQAERTRQNAAVTGAPEFATNTATAAYAPYTGYSSLFPNVRSTTAPYFNNRTAGILGGALAGRAVMGT